MIMIMMTRFGLGSDRWNIARCWFSCFIGYLYSILYVFVEYIDRVRILVNDYRMFFFKREEKIKFKMDFWKARNLPFHIFLFITNEKSHSCRFNRRNTFEKISRFRSTNSIQFTKICLNIADYDYTSSILSSFSSTFRCIKRYPSRIEKQINRKKREEEEERFGWGVCAQWRGDGGGRPQGYFSMGRGRDILEAAIRAKSSSKGSLGIIENDRTYYCISRRGSLVTRWSTDTGEQPRYPRVIRQDKGIHCEGSDRHRGG